VHKKQQKILNQIFEDPVRSDVKWNDIEKLLFGLGAEISEGKGVKGADFSERGTCRLSQATS